MTDREIQQFLLDHYKKHIGLLPGNLYHAIDYVIKHRIYNGPAIAANHLLGEGIFLKDWYLQYELPGIRSWTKPPITAQRRKDLVERLQVVIDILETLIKAQP